MYKRFIGVFENQNLKLHMIHIKNFITLISRETMKIVQIEIICLIRLHNYPGLKDGEFLCNNIFIKKKNC